MSNSTLPGDEHTALSIVLKILQENFKEALWAQNRYHRILYVGLANTLPTQRHISVMRKSLDKIDWQVVRSAARLQTTTGEEVATIGIAPIARKRISVAYHATRTLVLPRILTEGLLPSNEARRATDFPDTKGLIHVCERLGESDDEKETARWWMVELSRKNRFGDHDWSIIKIDMSKLKNARVYQDMHSKSGIIIDRIPRIPGVLIETV
jgi:hypothetical protein